MPQNIRLSQFIVTYGPGSLIEGVEGPRVIPRSDIGVFSQGSGISPQDFEISDQRMSIGFLGGSGIYRLPSNAELGVLESRYIYRTKAFPIWKICLRNRNHKGNFSVLYSGSYCPVCNNSNRRGREAIRFIKACPNGHMDEVDWYIIAHGFNSDCPRGSSTWYKWHGGGGAISEIKIECPHCHSQKLNMGWAYNHDWHCTGRSPENEPLLSPPIRSACSENAKIIQRQASNLRIPDLVTLFTMPPRHTELHNLLQINPIYCGLAASQPKSFSQLQVILDNLVQTGLVSNLTRTQILQHTWGEIKNAIEAVKKPVETSYNNLLLEEFHSLMHGAVEGIPPVHGPSLKSPVLIEMNPHNVASATGPGGTVFRIAPVSKLRTVTVQRGFTRAVAFDAVPKLVDVSFPDPNNPQRRWYPGVEFLGEGLFISIEGEPDNIFKLYFDAASQWREACNKPESYPEYVFKFKDARNELDPLFVWWHSLSHVLIRAIATEAGYSSASIRERIYFENAEGGSRGGILLYATQPGSEGTLGGLIALAPYFQDILDSALEQIRSCSSDPLCDKEQFSIGRFNGSACYGCLLLSETSCDHRNMWLDRRTNFGEYALTTEILGTGPEIIKNGTRGVEPVIEEVIKNARKEIQIAAYVLTSRALHLVELLEDAAKRGVKITLILNSQTCRDRAISLKLDYLVRSFPHTKVINFKSLKKQLHAKVIVVDRNIAIIGSANFSWGGMYSNYEIGVLLEGNRAWEVAKILDQLSMIN